MNKKTRLFYGVSYKNNDDLDTREIFDNYDEAISFYNFNDNECVSYDLSIYEVENYYKDENSWNYDEYSNTFRHITTLKELSNRKLKRKLNKLN